MLGRGLMFDTIHMRVAQEFSYPLQMHIGSVKQAEHKVSFERQETILCIAWSMARRGCGFYGKKYTFVFKTRGANRNTLRLHTIGMVSIRLSRLEVPHLQFSEQCHDEEDPFNHGREVRQ